MVKPRGKTTFFTFYDNYSNFSGVVFVCFYVMLNVMLNGKQEFKVMGPQNPPPGSGTDFIMLLSYLPSHRRCLLCPAVDSRIHQEIRMGVVKISQSYFLSGVLNVTYIHLLPDVVHCSVDLLHLQCAQMVSLIEN